MEFNEYQIKAARTCVYQDVFTGLPATQDAQDHILNPSLGLAGESGEFCDMVKKVMYHGHTMDKDKMVKELGDILWYISTASSALGVTLNEVAELNVKKLEKRYPEGFSHEASINRIDK